MDLLLDAKAALPMPPPSLIHLSYGEALDQEGGGGAETPTYMPVTTFGGHGEGERQDAEGDGEPPAGDGSMEPLYPWMPFLTFSPTPAQDEGKGKGEEETAGVEENPPYNDDTVMEEPAFAPLILSRARHRPLKRPIDDDEREYAAVSDWRAELTPAPKRREPFSPAQPTAMDEGDLDMDFLPRVDIEEYDPARPFIYDVPDAGDTEQARALMRLEKGTQFTLGVM
jgi:hypothetical protein